MKWSVEMVTCDVCGHDDRANKDTLGFHLEEQGDTRFIDCPPPLPRKWDICSLMCLRVLVSELAKNRETVWGKPIYADAREEVVRKKGGGT